MEVDFAQPPIEDADINALIGDLHPNGVVTAAMADAMAASLAKSPDSYDDGPEMARALAVALRRRAIRMRASVLS